MKYIQSSILASLMLLLATPQLHAMDINTEWGYIRDINPLIPHINVLSNTVHAGTDSTDKADMSSITRWLQAYINVPNTRILGKPHAPFPTIVQLSARLKSLSTKYTPSSPINLESHCQKVTNIPVSINTPIFRKELVLAGGAHQASSFASSQPGTSKSQYRNDDDEDDDSDDESDDSDSDDKSTFFERIRKSLFPTAKTIESVQLLDCSFVKYDMDNVISNIDTATITSNNAEKIRIDRKNAVEIRHWIELYRNSSRRYVPHATAAALLKRAHELTAQYATITVFGKTEISAPEKVSSDCIFNDPLVLSSQNYGANFAHSALKLVQNRFVIAGGAVAAVATIYWYYTKEAPDKSAQNEVHEELEITQEIN